MDYNELMYSVNLSESVAEGLARAQDFSFASLLPWQLWALIGVGILLAIFGYRIKKIAFFVIWFVLGFMLMGYLMPTINSAFPDIASSDLWQWLLPLAGGLLLALLGFSIEKVCVAGICFGLVLAATVEYFGTEMQVLAAGAVVGVIAAGAATMLMKPATIIATAFAGAYLVAGSLPQLFPAISIDVWYWPILIGVTVIGGLIQQFATAKHH